MRRLRKLTVLLLVAALVGEFRGHRLAAAPDVIGTRFAAAVEYLTDLGVISGYPDGTFRPALTISRAEACKVIVIMTEGDSLRADLLRGATPFSDVPSDHWASGFIALAKLEGIVNGFPDGTFKPASNVTYAEFAKMLVEAAGLSPAPGFGWPANYVSAALTAGMLADVPGFESNTPAIRGDCAIMAAYTVQSVPNPATGRTLAQSVFGLGAGSITLTPATGAVPVGGSLSFTALVKDLDGNPIENAALTWTTSDPSKSVVSNTGLFLASSPGMYTVSASYGGATGTAAVSVFGHPFALRASPAQQTVPANGATEVEITVEVVDLGGNRVANENEVEITMEFEDSNGAVELDGTVLTVKDGVAVFVVTSTNSEGVTDELLFTADDLQEDTAQITTVDQIATGMTIEADPAELMANDVDLGQVIVTVVDQSGQRMLSGTYEIELSIEGEGLMEGGTEDLTIYTSAQRAIVDVSSEKGSDGSFTITATSEGLGTVETTITTYFAGSPVGLAVAVNDGLGTADKTDMEVTVTIVDKYGRPTVRTEATLVEFETEDGDWTSLGPLTIPADTPRATETFGGDQSGTFTITAKDSDDELEPAEFTVTVAPGEPAALTLTPDADPMILLPIASPVVTLTAQVVDEYGNAVPEAGIKVTFTAVQSVSGKGSATFSPDDEVLTDATGRAVVTMTAQKYVGALYTVTAETDFDTVSTASQGIRVTDTVPSSISIVTERDAVKVTSVKADADQTIDVTITVLDGSDNPVDNGFDITVTFSNDGENIQNLAGLTEDPDEDGVFWGVTDAAGEVLFSFQGAKVGSFTITATAVNAPTGVSAVKGFSTKAGTVMEGLLITRTDGTAADDVDYDEDQVLTLRVSAVDYGGNPMVASEAIAVQLVPDYGTAQYRTSASGTEVTQVTIDAGRSYKTIYYVDSEAREGVDLSDDAHE